MPQLLAIFLTLTLEASKYRRTILEYSDRHEYLSPWRFDAALKNDKLFT